MARSRRQTWPRLPAASNICGCCRSRQSRTGVRRRTPPAMDGSAGRARQKSRLSPVTSRCCSRPARVSTMRSNCSLLTPMSGGTLADAVANHPALFPPMYAALVRVGEVSGTLDQVLEMLGVERARSEQMRRKLTDAMQYPAFVMVAASAVMLFFILFVLPQFSSVLQDFGGTKSDTALSTFIKLSEFLRANATAALLTAAATVAGGWWLVRRPGTRAAIVSGLSRLPGIGGIFQFYRSSLFCRNLGVLLGSGVNLTATLRILVDIMATTGSEDTWTAAADRVRHGGKLSDALSVTTSLPPMAVRMLRLGEETGQLPALAGRVAEFYEAKLQRSLDRVVAIVGPLAIITISTVVGGLIVSVMTALLSVTQLVG